MAIKILKGALIFLAIAIVLVDGLILFLKFWWFPYQERKNNQNIILEEEKVQPTTLNIPKKVGYVYCPILLYHHIAKVEPQDSYSVSPEIFDQQMKWIKDNGYTVISYDDFYQAMSRKKPLPAKPVVITFDDGVSDQYQSGFPILQKYGFSAMFFLKMNNIGKSGRLSWTEIKKMRDAGMEIDSHSVNHDNMAKMDLATMRTELSESKKTLEDNLGIDIKYFAYPGGAYSATTEIETKVAGYLSATTTKHEVYHKIAGDFFAVSRIHIDDEMPTFTLWIQGKNLY